MNRYMFDTQTPQPPMNVPQLDVLAPITKRNLVVPDQSRVYQPQQMDMQNATQQFSGAVCAPSCPVTSQPKPFATMSCVGCSLGMVFNLIVCYFARKKN